MFFFDALPVKKTRSCLHCYRPFNSSSAADRVCPKCRRKHNKLLDKYGGVVTYTSTPQMSAHIDGVIDKEAASKHTLSPKEINAFLDGDSSIDDSCVYRKIKYEKKRTAPAKSRAVFILKGLFAKENYNVSKKSVKIFYW